MTGKKEEGKKKEKLGEYELVDRKGEKEKKDRMRRGVSRRKWKKEDGENCSVKLGNKGT